MARGSPERKVKGLDARIEKLNFELAIGDWPGLPNEPTFGFFLRF